MCGSLRQLKKKLERWLKSGKESVLQIDISTGSIIVQNFLFIHCIFTSLQKYTASLHYHVVEIVLKDLISNNGEVVCALS